LTAPVLDRPATAPVPPTQEPTAACAARCTVTLPRADAPYCGKLGRKSETCPDDQTGCNVC